MEAYQRQQFDFLLLTAVERFAERIVQRCGGPGQALAQLRADPQGEGIWLDSFAQAIFRDFLLDNAAGACFVLQALARRSATAPSAGPIEAMLGQLALRAFADLLAAKAEEALEQQASYS
ncbi:hypothetical protein [Kouleothrix sp.]|uniref:hypothetical protein n=1 Tax=Kouleothrix sp. TaxID=2779161 RepID=UPI00391A8F7A